jgi:hypothetical protein
MKQSWGQEPCQSTMPLISLKMGLTAVQERAPEVAQICRDLYRHDITFGDDSKCFPSINVAQPDVDPSLSELG